MDVFFKQRTGISIFDIDMKNEETYTYLTGLGFKYRKSIQDAENAYAFYDLEGVMTLKLFRMAKVTDFSTLIFKIQEQSFENGKNYGKEIALKAIGDKLRKIIFDV